MEAASSDGSIASQSFNIAINDVDEFDVTVPTDVDAAVEEVTENAVIGTTVGITADAFDLDATNNTITYSLTSNPDGLFTIDPTSGVVTTAAAIDRELHGATRSITVEAASSDGSVASQAFNLTIHDLDEFDVGAVSDNDATVNAVDENAASGATVGVTALASDADATNNTITYTLDDTAGGRFKIDAVSGVVTVDNGTLLDREAAASHNITVRATSSDGSFNTAVMTINLNSVNDNMPVITSNGGGAAAVISLAENGTVVTTVTAIDADLPGQTMNYSIAGGADAGQFAIDSATGELTFITPPDYEAPADTNGDNVYEVIVQADDGAGASDSQSLSVFIDDLRVSLDSKTTGSTSGSGLTLSHTAAGDDRLMLVTVSMAHPDGESVNNITYNGTSLFLVGTTGGGHDALVEIWGLVAPDLGTHDVVVSLTGSPSEGTIVGVSTFAGVDQSTPLGTFTSATGDSSSLAVNVGSAEDELVFAAITVDNGDNQSLSPGAGQTEYWDLYRGHANAGASVEDGATTVNMSWNFGDGNPWAVGGISIRPTIATNLAPTITSNGGGDTAAINLNENGTTVATVSATDADLPAQTILYSIAGGDDAGRFVIDSNTGELSFIGAPDFEAPLDSDANNTYELIVQASDGQGGSDSQQIVVTISDVDEFDVGTVADMDATTNEVTENAIAGTPVGITASASDADGTNNTITYSLVDNDGGRFAIDATTGAVTVAGAIDRELDGATRNITVRATSSDTSFTDQVFAININDVDEFDVTVPADANGATNQVVENVAIGTAVGVTADAFDLDATNNTVTYSLTSNPDGLFTIDANTGVVSTAAAIDRELHGATRSITVKAASSDGSVASQTFNITINDVDEFDVSIPTDTDGTADQVTENVVIGTTVGITADAFDLDATNNTVTYSLTSNPDGLFTIDANSGLVTTAAAIDRELHGATRSITVEAASSDGSVASQSFNITVNDVDEFDVSIPTDTDGTADQVTENVVIGTTVGITADAFDLDATNNTVTYSLTSNPDGLFTIDANTGVVTTAAAIDRELHGATRSITVQAASSDGSVASQAFNITINDVDEFDITVPTDADAAADEVTENVAVGSTVGITADAFDLDATNNTVTYSLTSNPDGLFAIDANTGVVTTAAAIDRELQGVTRSITVEAASSDGSVASQSFNITINDVDEFDVGAVTDSDITANAVNENAAVGTVVGITAGATDADATNNTITYTLQDNDGGRFTIDSTTGVVTVAGAVDREADGPSRSITVRATSADSSFTDQVFSITVNDIDEFDVTPTLDADLAVNEVDENAALGTTVGVIASADDADATDTVSYSLDDNDGGRFAIDSTTGVVTVAGAIDREADGATRSITVRTTSTDGSFTTQSSCHQHQRCR